MRQDKAHGLAYWIGLAALALQIAFAPALSVRALAMDLDPLAMAKLCEPGRDVPTSPDHAGHCTDCCMAVCVSQAMPALAAAFEPAFEPPGAWTSFAYMAAPAGRHNPVFLSGGRARAPPTSV
jgi:hypothetical protein